MSFLVWLRKTNHTPAKPILYKDGNTLVGLKQMSPFLPEFFFQEILMNYPHRNTNTLYHVQHNELPKELQFFASAIDLLPEWKCVKLVRKRFEGEGHRQAFVETILAYITSLHDMLKLWKLRVITTKQLSLDSNVVVNRFTLTGSQLTAFEFIKNSSEERSVYYSSLNACQFSDEETLFDIESGELDVDMDSQELEVEMCQSNSNSSDEEESRLKIDWKKYILLTGVPRTGKTQVMLAAIDYFLKLDRKILVATPTGHLASQYREQFHDEVICDTIHSAFRYPVGTEERPLTNWFLSNFYILVIGEVSMVSTKIFEHVIRTINELTVRPLVLVLGDKAQQQPLETMNSVTTAVCSILEEPQFYGMVYKFNLTIQHRCDDVKYQEFMNHIRMWQPTQNLLDNIQSERLQTIEDNPSDNDIIEACVNNPQAVVLTVSRKASSKVNHVVIEALFDQEEPLAVIQCDDETAPIKIYKDMKVMITQNRDKASGVVNGQLANVHMVENSTVVLRLKSGRLVNTYPVTYDTQNGDRIVCFPFIPSYALTIAKLKDKH